MGKLELSCLVVWKSVSSWFLLSVPTLVIDYIPDIPRILINK